MIVLKLHSSVATHPYFHPVWAIPSTVPSDDLNISPGDGYIFSLCRSLQNVQLLSCCNGVLACVSKYIMNKILL